MSVTKMFSQSGMPAWLIVATPERGIELCKISRKPATYQLTSTVVPVAVPEKVQQFIDENWVAMLEASGRMPA